MRVWTNCGSTEVTDAVIHQHFQVSRALKSQETVAGTLQEKKIMEWGSVTPVRLMQQPDQWPKFDPWDSMWCPSGCPVPGRKRKVSSVWVPGMALPGGHPVRTGSGSYH